MFITFAISQQSDNFETHTIVQQGNKSAHGGKQNYGQEKAAKKWKLFTLHILHINFIKTEVPTALEKFKRFKAAFRKLAELFKDRKARKESAPLSLDHLKSFKLEKQQVGTQQPTKEKEIDSDDLEDDLDRDENQDEYINNVLAHM